MKKLLHLAVFLLLFVYTGFSQTISKGADGMYADRIVFSYGQGPVFQQKVILAGDKIGLSASDSYIQLAADKDYIGMQHYRYQQRLGSIPIEGAVYIVHTRNGKVVSQNGKWVKDFPSGLLSKPKISFTNALERAIQFTGAKQYKWQVPAEEAFIKREQNDLRASFFPKQQLVYYSPSDDITPSALRLCFKMDIYAQYPLSRNYVFIDAENGKVLGETPLIKTADLEGTAATAYSGTKTIKTTKVGNSYKLSELNRGNGINTQDMRMAGTGYYAASEFLDDDNMWNNVNSFYDQYATDAHWGAEVTYDYFKNIYGRNSIDNNGYILNNYVHVDLVSFGYANNINAFWDGSRMSYGDGYIDAGVTPFTTLDIAGHEISHGLTSYTSNLNYINESGALNEGFSDIFATAIEFYGRPERANWTIGEDVGYTFRSLSNPKAFGHPDTYLGTNWYVGTADYGGVHKNSGVVNYWFYLLCQGKNGTNDFGYAYNITGLGIDKAAAIAYRTNVFYLTPTSNFANARTYSIQAAEDLYGAGSIEALTVSCAWAAVNIGTCNTASVCNAPAGLQSSGVDWSTATLKWNVVSGVTAYTLEYKSSTTGTWDIAAANLTDTVFQLTGLLANTNYNWRVASICGSSTSVYTESNFTTLEQPQCGLPGNLTASNITPASATLGWASATNATSYRLQYRLSGAANWITISDALQSTSYTLTGLTENTNYEWRVSANCSFGSGDWKQGPFATPPLPCNAAVSLSASSTTTSTTVLSWAGASNAITYSVEYRALGASVWTTAATNLSGSTYTLADLMIQTTYQWRVTSFCNSGSAISAIATFSTLGDTCPGIFDISANNTLNNPPMIPVARDIKGKIYPGGDNDYYKFNLPNSGQVNISLTSLPANYDLYLINSGGLRIGASERSGTNSESIALNLSAGNYYIRIKGRSGSQLSNTYCYNLNVSLLNSVFSIAAVEPVFVAEANDKVLLYPNPANDFVTISLSTVKDAELNIFDINGKVVLRRMLLTDTEKVNVSNLAAGTYLVKIDAAGKSFTSKFVKR